MTENNGTRRGRAAALDADGGEMELEGHHQDVRFVRSSEGSSSLSGGQIVIVSARWLLIVTGFIVTLWSPKQADLDTVRVVLLCLFALAIGNFFVHAQILRKRPLEPSLLYLASAVDLGIITLIVWQTGGLGSSSFVYYYPALLALALVFPLRMVGYFVVGLMAVYSVVSLPAHYAESDLQVLTARLISLLAVGVVGYIYQDIERRRRERLAEADGLGLPASARPA